MTNNSQNTKKLILVLGMHRSGTSLISRSLKVFGAMHGENLIPFTVGNVKGHWEDQDFYLLNKEMLKFLRKDWDSVLPITEVDVQNLFEAGYAQKVENLLNSRFEQMHIFALKDPRVTKLLAFWLEVLASMPITVNLIYAIRNPFSVAKSLQGRNNLPLEHGLLLWYSYNAFALRSLKNTRVLFLDYDAFLNDAYANLERMSTYVNLPMNQHECDIFLNSFLDKNLRNFSVERVGSFSNDEKPYINAYKCMVKHLNYTFVSSEYIEKFNQGVLFATLEKLGKN